MQLLATLISKIDELKKWWISFQLHKHNWFTQRFAV